MTNTLVEQLDYIRCYHQCLAHRHLQLADQSEQNANVKQMFKYLSQWEQKRSKALYQELKDSDFSTTLKTWLKENPAEPKEVMLKDIEKQLPQKQYSAEELMQVISAQHNLISDTYQQLADISSTESMTEFFSSLAEQEDTELRRVVDSIQHMGIVH